MKFYIVVLAVLLLVVQAFAQNSSPKPVGASAVDKIDCNAPPKDITCSIGQTKRVYYDSKNKECKLLAKGTCAGNPSNQFTTISACKHKCIIPNQRGTTPKV